MCIIQSWKNMQAIILAAGMGSRLKELTKNNTKCMVKVNGVTLIDRMLHQIEKNKIDRIIIVVGYKGDILKEYINSLDIKIPITFVESLTPLSGWSLLSPLVT